MLCIENLTKTYRKKDEPALSEVSFQLNAGDICGVVGAVNSGRTTLLDIIAGDLTFESGTITVDGKSLADDPEGCAAVSAYIPERPGFIRTMTGFDHLRFIADMYRLSAEERAQRIEHWSSVFELEEQLDEFISRYSDAARHRLAIVAALIRQPRLLILDNPFKWLDAHGGELLEDTLRRLSSEGVTVVFSSSALEPVEKLCSKVAYLIKGRLISFGSPSELAGESGSLSQAIPDVDPVSTDIKSSGMYSSPNDEQEYFPCTYNKGRPMSSYGLFRDSTKPSPKLGLWGTALLWATFVSIPYALVYRMYLSGHVQSVPLFLFVAAAIATFSFGLYKSGAVLFGRSPLEHSFIVKLKDTPTMAGRLLKTWLFNSAVCATVLLPGLILYGTQHSPGILFWVTSLVTTFGLPALTLAAALLLNSLWSLLLSRAGIPWLKSLIGVLVLLCVMFFLRITLPEMSNNQLSSWFYDTLGRAETGEPLCRAFLSALTMGKGAPGMALTVLSLLWAACLAVPLGCALLFSESIQRALFSAPAPSGRKYPRPTSPTAALYRAESRYYMSGSVMSLGCCFLAVLAVSGLPMNLAASGNPLRFSWEMSTVTCILFFTLTLVAAINSPSLFLFGEPWEAVRSTPASLRSIIRTKLYINLVPAVVTWAICVLILDTNLTSALRELGLQQTLADRLWFMGLHLVYAFLPTILFLLVNTIHLRRSVKFGITSSAICGMLCMAGLFFTFFVLRSQPEENRMSAMYIALAVMAGIVLLLFIALMCMCSSKNGKIRR